MTPSDAGWSHRSSALLTTGGLFLGHQRQKQNSRSSALSGPQGRSAGRSCSCRGTVIQTNNRTRYARKVCPLPSFLHNARLSCCLTAVAEKCAVNQDGHEQYACCEATADDAKNSQMGRNRKPLPLTKDAKKPQGAHSSSVDEVNEYLKTVMRLANRPDVQVLYARFCLYITHCVAPVAVCTQDVRALSLNHFFPRARKQLICMSPV